MSSESEPKKIDLSGANLDGIVIESKLGQGGMGEIWRGRHEDLDIPVAVKVLPPHLASNQNFLLRFLREARAIAKLDHKNIVRVLDAGRREFKGQTLRVMIMELIEGQDAHQLRKASPNKKLAPERACEIALATAKALRYAHAKGVIHRDIKPANILIAADKETIKVLDFGLAKLSAERDRLLSRSTTSTRASMLKAEADAQASDKENPSHGDDIVGTPHYMPPEQVEGGHVDGKADIYSLGITLFELLTGTLPFNGDSVFSVISAQIHEPLPLSEEHFGVLPPIYADMLSGMCAKAPADRWSIGRVIETLEELLGVSQASTEAMASPFVDRPITNLQKRTSSFIGRGAELRALKSEFESHEKCLVTIIGPGGVGKTRFSQEFGLGVLGQYDEGVWFCDLTEARNAAGIAIGVARGLDIPLSGKDPIAAIGQGLRLRRGRMLLILDNFEQVTEFAAETLGEWLLAAGDVHVLVSSREPLHIEGERSFPLAPLEGDDFADGVALFVARAQEVKRGFKLNDQNRDAIKTIVQDLDAIPLAIELAAARSASLSPRRILERLPKRFDLLQSRRRDQSTRQMTLRGAIDWSWNLLEPAEQLALAQCSIFRDGFFLDAAEAILDLSSVPDAPFEIDVIEALCEKSLLRAIESESLDGELRYRMLESVREYAAEKMANWPDVSELVSELQRRHAEFYLAYAETWREQIHSPKCREAQDRLGLELENYFAIQDTFEASDPILSVQAVFGFLNTLERRGPRNEHQSRLHRALEGLGTRDPKSRIHLLAATAKCEYMSGSRAKEMEYALLTLEETRAYEGEEREALLAKALNTFGLAADHDGNSEGTIAAFEESIEIYRRLGNDISRAGMLLNLAGVLNALERNEESLLKVDEAEVLIREAGDSFWLPTVYGKRGNALRGLGRVVESMECHHKGRELSRALGDLLGFAVQTNGLAIAHANNNQLDEAVSYAREAEGIARRIGSPQRLLRALGNRGIDLMTLERFDEAWEALDEAETISRETVSKYPLAYWLDAKAKVTLLRPVEKVTKDDLNAALANAQEAIAIREELGLESTKVFAMTRATLMRTHWRLGEAGDESHRSLARELAKEVSAALAGYEDSLVVTAGPDKGEANFVAKWINAILGDDL